MPARGRTSFQDEPMTRQEKARHRASAAHERARYRCFLPDLAGLAGKRRAEPMPDASIVSNENLPGASDLMAKRPKATARLPIHRAGCSS